ncbi:MAG: DMT family transporter [Promethearchaeota archaeon]
MLNSEIIKTNNPKISKISMLISAISMGCVGVFVTLLQAFSIFAIVLLRGIFGTLFLTLFMIRTKSFSINFLKESLYTHWKLLLIIGIINPLIIYLYFLNISISGYAIAAFLLYTNGIIVILFLIIDRIETISKTNILSFILAIIGVAIIMEFWVGFQLTWGLILGLLSSVFLALLIFCKKKIYIIRNQNSSKIINDGNFDIFLAWWPTLFLIIIFLPISGFELLYLTLMDLIYSILLGLIPTAIAFTLYNVGVKNDKGGNIIILAYIEPIVATICEFFIHSEFSLSVFIGGSFILIANILILKYS